MERQVQVYYGDGQGKTTAAVGQCIKEASTGRQVIIIQFLKGKDTEELSSLLKLEPEIKLFRFEKETESFAELSEDGKREEEGNIRNGFNFAKKVLETGECDLLVLDEVLGLLDYHIISEEDLIQLIQLLGENHKLILTGLHLPKALLPYVGAASEIRFIK